MICRFYITTGKLGFLEKRINMEMARCINGTFYNLMTMQVYAMVLSLDTVLT